MKAHTALPKILNDFLITKENTIADSFCFSVLFLKIQGLANLSDKQRKTILDEAVCICDYLPATFQSDGALIAKMGVTDKWEIGCVIKGDHVVVLNERAKHVKSVFHTTTGCYMQSTARLYDTDSVPKDLRVLQRTKEVVLGHGSITAAVNSILRDLRDAVDHTPDY